MIKVRLHGMCEEVSKFKAYLETLSPRVQILCSSDNYADRGKSKYIRSYLDVELKPLGAVGEYVRQLVREKYAKSYENFLLWTLNWSDIDGVLEYLYHFALRNPTQQAQVNDVINFIKEHSKK